MLQKNGKTENNKLLPPVQPREVITLCPFCYSEGIRVRTRRNGGGKDYSCENCGKTTSKPMQLDENGERAVIVCPHPNCGGSVTLKGKSNNGKQRYRCSKCNKITVNPEIIIEKLQITEEKFCKKCPNTNNALTKYGFNRYSRQNYRCRICRRVTCNVGTCQVRAVSRVN